ncbi:hypothetical protein B0H19DRAFT_1083091 [Mycena capillaripes]|nr:hypothetical protein B0H19DRAFT_1083091 [Mycena capillaripes]
MPVKSKRNGAKKAVGAQRVVKKNSQLPADKKPAANPPEDVSGKMSGKKQSEAHGPHSAEPFNDSGGSLLLSALPSSMIGKASNRRLAVKDLQAQEKVREGIKKTRYQSLLKSQNERVLEEEHPSQSDQLSQDRREQRRADKQRRHRADSIESAEMREAAVRSMKDLQTAEDIAEERGPPTWEDDRILKAAREALAREREMHENTEEFSRRRAAFERTEKLLRSVRVSEDRRRGSEAAETIQRDEQASIARRKARLEQAQRAMAEEEAAIKAVEERARHTAASVSSSDEILAEYLAREEAKHKTRRRHFVETESSSEDTVRYRIADMEKMGDSRIPDQGVDWDSAGKAFEKSPPKSRGSFVGTWGGKSNSRTHEASSTGNSASKNRLFLSSPTIGQEKPMAESSRNNAGEDKGSSRMPNKSSRVGNTIKENSSEFYQKTGTAPKQQGGGVPPSSSLSSSSSVGANKPKPVKTEPLSKLGKMSAATGGVPPGDSSSASSSDNESKPSRARKNPRKYPEESDRKHKKRRQKNSHRNHHARGAAKEKLHLHEAGDPFLDGIPVKQQKKWQKSLHAPFIKYHNKMLGKESPPSPLFDVNKNIRLPPPEKYAGSKDIKIFEQHVSSICGEAFDEKRKGLHSFYLTGTAKEWYDNNVNGIMRVKKKWTHLEMILGLFNQFIDTACLHRTLSLGNHTEMI